MKKGNRMKDSVGAVAIKRAGFIRGQQGLTFAAAWWIATYALDRPPVTVDEYAAWWRESRSQAFREQAAFRECFPEFSTPTELLDALGLDIVEMKYRRGQESKVVRELFSVAAP